MISNIPISSIIVPCTNRKISHLGDPVSYKDCDGSIESWLHNLSVKETGVRPAMEVYCGTAWSNIIKTKQVLPSVKFRIVSAGYGLINDNTPISNYQATFQSRTINSVGRSWSPQSHANQLWWHALVGKDWYQLLAKEEGLILLQLSSIYLKALEPGLVKLAKKIGDRLIILSPGYKTNIDILAKKILPIDSRFEHIVKTTRSNLGSAALKWLIDEFPTNNGWDIQLLHKDLNKIFKSLPPIQVHSRKIMQDEEVLNFIEINAKQLKQAYASPLLKKLRESNFACEQKRFAKLFEYWKSNNKARIVEDV
jgi:hypothetical protein